MKFFSRFGGRKSKGGSQQSANAYIPYDAPHLAHEVEIMKRHNEIKAARRHSTGGIHTQSGEKYVDLTAQNDSEIIERQCELKAARRQSTGRGGLGNMASSMYRIEETEHLNAQNEMMQRQRELKEARRQSVGRGGLGNITITGPIYREETEELIAQNENELIQWQRELKASRRQSIGRGGLGNIDQSQIVIQECARQSTERHQEAEMDKHNSSGRRGLRNIFRFINRGFKKPSRQASTSSTLVMHNEDIFLAR